jgi:hypothetical protein
MLPPVLSRTFQPGSARRMRSFTRLTLTGSARAAASARAASQNSSRVRASMRNGTEPEAKAPLRDLVLGGGGGVGVGGTAPGGRL